MGSGGGSVLALSSLCMDHGFPNFRRQVKPQTNRACAENHAVLAMGAEFERRYAGIPYA